MKFRTLLAVMFALAWYTGSTRLLAEDGWRQLFNGRDLKGWRANVHPDSFRVDDGLLRAHCTAKRERSHLFFVGDSETPVPFKNFELEVVFRGEPKSNSGIFFHTDESTRDARLHLAKGYEVNLNNSPSEKQKTGSLYAVTTAKPPTVDDTKWTTLNLTVKDKRIVVRLNGRTVVDYTEPDDVQRPANRRGRRIDPQGGAIAVQAHDPQSVYLFKEIRIRKLP